MPGEDLTPPPVTLDRPHNALSPHKWPYIVGSPPSPILFVCLVAMHGAKKKKKRRMDGMVAVEEIHYENNLRKFENRLGDSVTWIFLFCVSSRKKETTS